jgi:ATP-dependent Clp protease ATP-binding subunit ClpA
MNKLAYQNLYQTALIYAEQNNHDYITVDQIVAAMVIDKDFSEILKYANVDLDLALTSITTVCNQSYSHIDKHQDDITKILENVLKSRSGYKQVLADQSFDQICKKLVQHNKDYETNLTKVDFIQYIIDTFPTTSSIVILEKCGLNKEKLKEYKKIAKDGYVNQFGIDLTALAKKGKIDQIIGRDEETLKILLGLLRKRKSNVILTGDAGVGKTAIAEGLALKIANKEVPENLQNKRVFNLDLNSVVAGTKFRGEFEERMKKIIDELSQDENTILFIDEIHQLMGMNNGENSAMNAAQILKPALSRGNLKLIGATDTENYRKILQKDKPLMRRFQEIVIDEPSAVYTKQILHGLKESFENFHNVKFSDLALDVAVDLSGLYITNRKWPDKAIDLIDAAGARALFYKKTSVEESDIEFELTQITKIRPQKAKKEESSIYDLAKNIKQRIFEQDQAIETLVDSVAIAKCGMRDTNKPLGRYLFVGPSGTGKTEVCRELAKELNIPLLKYDMSEYMEGHSISKLIGSPPGYVGYSDGSTGSGRLINDIETNPNAILLLDEFEKAHPSIFNAFLQVLDDAKLTSSDGKTVKFNNVIIIMTSNAGAAKSEKSSIGFNLSENNLQSNVMEAVEKTFSPEFRNRLDEVVVFNRLSKAAIKQVAKKFLDRLNSQLSENSNQLSYSEAVIDFLAKKGYNPKMGARPMERAITDFVKKQISKKMFENRHFENVKVSLDVINEEIKVEIA